MDNVLPRPLPWKIRLGYLIPLLALASLPLVMYFQYENGQQLLVMWVILVLVEGAFSLRTAAMAARTMVRFRQMGGNWDLLALTGVEGRWLPGFVWRSVVRRTWIDHALLALPRLGVALGFAQYLETYWAWPAVTNLLSLDPGQFPTAFLIQPQLHSHIVQILFSLAVLSTFAIIQALVAAASGVFWGMYFSRRPGVLWAAAVTWHMLFWGIIATAFVVSADISRHRFSTAYVWHVRSNLYMCLQDHYHWELQERGEPTGLCVWVEEPTESCQKWQRRLTLLRIVEGTQLTLLSILDQGVLLSTDVLRPTISSQRSDSLSVSVSFDRDHISPTLRRASERTLRSAGLGLGIYGALIGAMLWAARVGLRRRGFD